MEKGEEVWTYSLGDKAEVIGPFRYEYKQGTMIKGCFDGSGNEWWIPEDSAFSSKKDAAKALIERLKENVEIYKEAIDVYEKNIAKHKMLIAQLEEVEEIQK